MKLIDLNDTRFHRRLRFSAIVIVSQMLLIALSLAWGIYLLSIARNGGVLSVENNPWILYGEIFATVLIIQFALVVIAMELLRLRSRRARDDRGPYQSRRTADNNQFEPTIRTDSVGKQVDEEMPSGTIIRNKGISKN